MCSVHCVGMEPHVVRVLCELREAQARQVPWTQQLRWYGAGQGASGLLQLGGLGHEVPWRDAETRPHLILVFACRSSIVWAVLRGSLGHEGVWGAALDDCLLVPETLSLVLCGGCYTSWCSSCLSALLHLTGLHLLAISFFWCKTTPGWPHLHTGSHMGWWWGPGSVAGETWQSKSMTASQLSPGTPTRGPCILLLLVLSVWDLSCPPRHPHKQLLIPLLLLHLSTDTRREPEIFVSSQFTQLSFDWYFHAIFFHSFIVILSIYSKLLFRGWQIVLVFYPWSLFILFDKLCLLLAVFREFTCNTIIDTVGFTSAILLVVFYLSHLFFNLFLFSCHLLS